MPKVEEGAAFAGVGLAVVSALNMYRDTAPDLKWLRCKPPGDFEARQLLLDADIFGLIVIIVVGGAGAVLIRRWYPLVLAASALLLVSGYYRAVLNSDHQGMVNDGEGTDAD